MKKALILATVLVMLFSMTITANAADYPSDPPATVENNTNCNCTTSDTEVEDFNEEEFYNWLMSELIFNPYHCGEVWSGSASEPTGSGFTAQKSFSYPWYGGTIFGNMFFSCYSWSWSWSSDGETSTDWDETFTDMFGNNFGTEQWEKFIETMKTEFLENGFTVTEVDEWCPTNFFWFPW